MAFVAGQKVTAAQLNSIGRVIGLVQATGNVAFTGTETIVDSITFDHVQSRYEQFRFTTRFSLNTTGVVIIRYRYVSGAGPVLTSSTQAYETIVTGSGSNNGLSAEKILNSTFRALASGTYTIAVSAQAAAGASSGTVNGGASGIERDFAGFACGME